MKKRDFFAVLAAGAAVTVVAQALVKWLWGESEYEEDYDDREDDDVGEDDEDDEAEEVENEALDDLLNYTYDEGFADGFNGTYQGCNPAAQVLQAELDAMLEECALCGCGIGDEEEEEETEEEAGEPEVAEKSEEQPT